MYNFYFLFYSFIYKDIVFVVKILKKSLIKNVILVIIWLKYFFYIMDMIKINCFVYLIYCLDYFLKY